MKLWSQADALTGYQGGMGSSRCFEVGIVPSGRERLVTVIMQNNERFFYANSRFFCEYG